MQILLACAKIMTGETTSNVPFTTLPEFLSNAQSNALQLAAYSPAQLQSALRCNDEIAFENWRRYQDFFDDSNGVVPAVFAYDGMVFRRFAPESMSGDDLSYANEHIVIGSFLYGLLRPLDAVHRYRLEGDVVLPQNGVNMFEYWRPVLTQWFIDKVKADDGVLVNLASSEFKGLFDWKRITSELEVITPEFKVMKQGKAKTIVIYTKMCRGAMARWIVENRVSDPRRLAEFGYEGFEHKSGALFLLE